MPDENRPVKQFTQTVADAVLENVGRIAGRVQERRPLDADLLESPDAYHVVFDAPGADTHDIDVRYLNGSVQVTVERFRDYREGYTMRFPGRGLTLRGSVTLPTDAIVDPTDGSAELGDDGTLHVTLPKRQDDDPAESPTDTG